MALPRVEGFAIVEKIGAGSYATVYKGYKKGFPRECVAVKLVERSSLKGSAEDNLITEIRLLKSLTHPHIVTMKDFLWDDRNIYIIMEYCNFGDLSKYVKKERGIDEQLCRRLLRQLALALQLLREKGVVHMDLKPQNLLLHKTMEGKIILKVGDFGFAQYMSDETKAKNMRGSPLYMAPEVFSIGVQKNAPAGYDASVDLWSVGVILYECLFGKAPYSSSTYKELVDKILSHKAIEIPAGPRISSDCRDLLARLLQHDPKQRISYEDFFQHSFLDLKHMPSPENYKKAVDLVQQAIVKDSSSEFEEAYHLYCESLRYFVPMVIEEYGSEAHHMLRNKVNNYIKRAEELKLYTISGSRGSTPSGSQYNAANTKLLPESSPKPNVRIKRKDISPKADDSRPSKAIIRSNKFNLENSDSSLVDKFEEDVTLRKKHVSTCGVTANISDTSSVISDHDNNSSSNVVFVREELPCIDNSGYLKKKENFEELYALCATTQQLQTGLDVGKSAEMYVLDGRLEEALTLYRSAISTLLKGCQNEPHGVRKAMLRDKIDEWLKEAESIKTLLESREMQQKHCTGEYSHKEQCCLQ